MSRKPIAAESQFMAAAVEAPAFVTAVLAFAIALFFAGCSGPTSTPAAATTSPTSAEAAEPPPGPDSPTPAPTSTPSPAEPAEEPTAAPTPPATPEPTATPLPNPVTDEDFAAIYRDLAEAQSAALRAGDVDALRLVLGAESDLLAAENAVIASGQELVDVTFGEITLMSRPTDDRALLRVNQTEESLDGGEDLELTILATLHRPDPSTGAWVILAKQAFSQGLLPAGDIPDWFGRPPQHTYQDGVATYSWTDGNRRCLETDFGELGQYAYCFELPTDADGDSALVTEVYDNNGQVATYFFVYLFRVERPSGGWTFQFENENHPLSTILAHDVGFEHHVAGWGPLSTTNVSRMWLQYGQEEVTVWDDPFTYLYSDGLAALAPPPPTAPPAGELLNCQPGDEAREVMLGTSDALANLGRLLPSNVWICANDETVRASVQCFDDLTDRIWDAARENNPDADPDNVGFTYVFCQAGDTTWLADP